MTHTSAQHRENRHAASTAVTDRNDNRPDQRHTGIIDRMPIGVLVFDNQECLAHANPAAIELLKDLVPEMDQFDLRSNLPIDRIFGEETFPGWVETLSYADNRSTQGRSINLIARTGDSERIFSVTTARSGDDSPSDVGLIVTLNDVTELEDNDQQLFEIEKSSDKGVMAAHIAHDLNNFLGLVLGGVEIAQMAMARGNTEKADRSLEKIKNNVGRFEEFTRGLEQLTTFETCRQETDFNQVVAGVLSYVAVQRKFNTLTIQARLDCSLPALMLDKAQIEQLLLNVLTNAADAVAESGRSDGLIIARTWLQDDCACLSIADNGAGIKPEIKERLFHSHLTTKPDNFGYGLVTCARIIGNHQARFEIESELGQGATFTFRFPLHPQAQTAESDS